MKGKNGKKENNLKGEGKKMLFAKGRKHTKRIYKKYPDKNEF